MIKRFSGLITAGLLAVMVVAGCGLRYRPPQIALPGQGGHPSLVLRFLAESDAERWKGRLVLDVDGPRARMLFLNPLNRVVMDLYVENDRALLVNRSRKRCWRGEFSILVQRVWQLQLAFSDLQRLLFDGIVPPALQRRSGIQVEMERDPASGLPRTLQLDDGTSNIRFTVLRRRHVGGRLDDPRDMEGMVDAELEEVISREN
ncbi:MAG: hypothetical protein RB296_02475 [Acidobacteriota bacterium]|jgi:hypothetical protein|nr:hypothetical protein [Acidobacteriota bacterium]